MYQDGHLAAAADERIQLLLPGYDLGSSYARQQYPDAAFARVSKHQTSKESIRSAAFACAAHFKSEAQRRQPLDTLAELLASDNKVTNEENRFMVIVEEPLNLKSSR